MAACSQIHVASTLQKKKKKNCSEIVSNFFLIITKKQQVPHWIKHEILK